MPFPSTERVIYGKNPLRAVICQLRFPPILRIETETPADFQEEIRHLYPSYTEPVLSLPAGLPPQTPRELARELRTYSPHRFESEDEKWTISLGKNFLAMSTTGYERWEDFATRLDVPLGALKAVYSPAFFERIGLRYQDLIVKADLGLENESWSELLQPHIAGALSSPNGVPEAVLETASRFVVALEEHETKIQVRHGLAEEESGSAGKPAYMIDSDFFSAARTGVDDAPDILEYFHRFSGSLFRWCLRDRLHRAMEPHQA